MKIFKTADEVIRDYGIPKATVYHRIKKHHYRVNDNYEILVADVEKVEREGVKKGRPRKYE